MSKHDAVNNRYVEKERKKQLKVERRKVRKQQKIKQIENRQISKERRIVEKNERLQRRETKRNAIYRKIRNCLRNDNVGFSYTNYGVLPRVSLEVVGDCVGIIDMLERGGICVCDFCKNVGFCSFKILKKDLHKAIAILSKTCYNYSVREAYGVGRIVRFWRCRIGILLGAVCSIILLSFAYSRIWRISVIGNERVPTSQILSVLLDNGVTCGLSKKQVKLTDVAFIVSKLDGISDASVELNGTSLCVRVLEANGVEKKSTYGGYKSTYDATVTRVVVKSGRATVNVGQIVKCGDVLVDGNVYSTNGEFLYSEPCDAEIYGNVSLTTSCTISDTIVEYRQTGAERVCTSISLFDKELFKPTPPYENYQVTATVTQFDLLLPIATTRYVYKQTELVETTVDIKTAVEAFAVSEIERLKFIGDFDYSYTLKSGVAGLTVVHVFISGEALISQGVEKLE